MKGSYDGLGTRRAISMRFYISSSEVLMFVLLLLLAVVFSPLQFMSVRVSGPFWSFFFCCKKFASFCTGFLLSRRRERVGARHDWCHCKEAGCELECQGIITCLKCKGGKERRVGYCDTLSRRLSRVKVLGYATRLHIDSPVQMMSFGGEAWRETEEMNMTSTGQSSGPCIIIKDIIQHGQNVFT